MATISQRSFSGGEISPSLYARVDTAKYATGLRTCRNMLVMRHGGAQNRAGSKFVSEVKDSTKDVRLIPFVFNASQTYVLEFGDLYMRVIKDGVLLSDLTLTITNISNANPAVVTYTGTDPVNGQEVAISGVVGAMSTYVNGRNFKIVNVNSGANTFELDYMDGTNVNSTGFGSYTSGGTAKRIYEIVTPYAEADLSTIQFVQSADVITIVHPSYAPRDLARTGDTSWTLTAIDFEPGISGPIYSAGVTGGSGTNVERYKVTAVAAETFEESYPGEHSGNGITNITQANPAVATIGIPSADTLHDGDRIRISGVAGMTEVNDQIYIIEFVAADQVELSVDENTPLDSTGFTAYSSGGTWYRQQLSGTGSGSVATPNVISWQLVSGAREYNIYRERNGIYGFIGTSKTNEFKDIGVDPDYSDQPTEARFTFSTADNYPSAVTYIQQRRAFANSNSEPEKIWLSQTGKFKNFTYRSPIQDDDAASFTIAGRQVNAVKHMLDVGQFLVFTTGGEWAIRGNAAGIITPLEVNAKQYSYNGSADLAPLVVGNNALYVQARGAIVRDLTFDIAVDGYRGNDLTIFSAHLFEGHSIVDWAFQQIPHSIVWAVRDDGVLLGLTYVREHEMWAWHRHDFSDGTVLNCTVVPEGDEDVLYLTVSRVINSRTVVYIERFHTRQVDADNVEDSIFMDSALSYDGWNTTATTMTISGGTNWTYDESLTLTASASYFTSSYVGKQIHLIGSDGTLIRFTIDAYTSATVVTGRANKTVPVVMRSTAISNWAYAISQISGLWHLEGKDISVFADGFVAASPNNDSYDTVTVTNGVATLDKPYAVVHAGLPYISDIETLDIDTPQGETIADKYKLIGKVSVFVEKSRGIWAGSNAPTDDATDPLEDLTELKIRDDEDYDSPVALSTGVVSINIKPEWNSHGRIFIRQVDPIPLSVLAVAPAGLLPFRG